MRVVQKEDQVNNYTILSIDGITLEKSFQREKAVTPKKISTANQFQFLTEDIEEYIQKQGDATTVDVNHNDADNVGKESKGMSTKDWVNLSFIRRT